MDALWDLVNLSGEHCGHLRWLRLRSDCQANAKLFRKVVQHVNVMYDVERCMKKLGGPLPADDIKESDEEVAARNGAMMEHTDAVHQLRRLVTREKECECNDGVKGIKSGPVYKSRADGTIVQAQSLLKRAGEFATTKKHAFFQEHLTKLKQICGGVAEGKHYNDTLPAGKAGKAVSWAVYSGHLNETLKKYKPAATLDVTVAEACKVLLWF